MKTPAKKTTADKSGMPSFVPEIPRNVDAERWVCGSMLISDVARDDVAGIVCEQDFFDEAFRALFRRMLAMDSKGKAIDSALLVNELKKSGDWEKFDGWLPMLQAVEDIPTAAHAVHYAQIVRDHATLRRLIEVGERALKDAYEVRADAETILEQTESNVSAIRDARASTTDRVSEIGDLLQRALSDIEARKDSKRAAGLSTGFEAIDEFLTLRPEELTILAARPGMGKTSLALNLAVNAAKSDESVLFVSLEMPEFQLSDRMLSCETGIPLKYILCGDLQRDDYGRLVEAAGIISPLKFFVDATPSRNIQQIVAVARRQKRRSGLGLIVIDYLQLIEATDRRVPREQQVSDMTRRLKQLARDLKVPVVCLAQLNRQSESTNAKPRLSNLRESGAIEQDADAVLFIHRPDEPAWKGMAEIIVGKNRHGSTGSLGLCYRGELTRFEPLAEDMHLPNDKREDQQQHGQPGNGKPIGQNGYYNPQAPAKTEQSGLFKPTDFSGDTQYGND